MSVHEPYHSVWFVCDTLPMVGGVKVSATKLCNRKEKEMPTEIKAPDKQKRHFVTYAGMWFVPDENAYVVYVTCLYGHESRIGEAVRRDLRVRTFEHNSINARKALDLVQSLNSARFDIEHKEDRLATLTDLFGVCDEAKVVVGI